MGKYLDTISQRLVLQPMLPAHKAALLKFRADNPAIGSALVFPMTNDPTKPVTRHLASDWMHRAYRYAGIERQKGGLWHPFRRKWATARKDYPLRDTMAAGGWEDEPTAMKYQQPDEDTLRQLIDNPKQLKKRSQNS